MADKRMTEDEVVAELRDGMTIGIGGWGSRRKPMALVREILRTPLKDLTIVAYGGPDLGLLCAAGKVQQGLLRLRLARLDPARAALPRARQNGAIESFELDEGMFQWGLYAAATRLPFLPDARGARLRLLDAESVAAHRALALRRRRRAGRDARVRARRGVHAHEPRRCRGNGQFLGPDPFFDDFFCMARQEPLRRPASSSSSTDGLPQGRVGAHADDQPHAWSTA